ncbi:MAG: bifunctional DNA primase/polymerase [Elusimicrobia bacterium]|nr:bifunctional DNA primase/polymerase [Elusimicrobiota bacterium]
MMLDRALGYIELGWAVFPLVPNAKKPLTKNGFKDAAKSAYLVRKWWTERPDANIGIATGEASGLAVVDVDVKNGAKGRESLASIKGMTPTLTAATPSGGWHLYYAWPEGGMRSKNGLLPGVDVKADGGYVVAPGSRIDGKDYEWLDPEAHIMAVPDAVIALMRNGTGPKPGPGPEPGGDIPEGLRNATLASMAGSMRKRGMDSEAITAALKVVNAKRCKPPLPEAEVEAVAASISRYPAAEGPGPPQPTAAEEEDDIRPPGFTDDALALEFTAKHAENWRYVAAWGYWLHWEGPRWLKETTLKAFDLARRTCREASARCQHPKIAAKIASAPTVAAVERLARADRRHAATAGQWDEDHLLFIASKEEPVCS